MYNKNSFKKEKSNVVTVLIAIVSMALTIYFLIGALDAPERGVCQDSYTKSGSNSVMLYYKACSDK